MTVRSPTTSLSTRIALTITVLLAVSGIAAGVALHRALRQAAEAQLRGRLDARLAWLEGTLDVEMDDGEVQLDAHDAPAGAAEVWEVADAGGRVLWSGGIESGALASPVARSKALSFGPATGPALPGAALSRDGVAGGAGGAKGRPAWERIPVETVPAPALAAARAARATFEPAEAWQRTRVKKKDRDAPATFELRGRAVGDRAGGGREYDVRVDAAGHVLTVKGRETGRYPAYHFSPADDVRLDLVLTARASAAQTEAELAGTARVLWTLGPLALAVTAAVLVLAIRWQLGPLKRMADEAARIGPANLGDASRVGPAGSSAELVRLRAAINSMLDRLAEGLRRERRFAATAAHELRTPLAQMRLALDVALRRERDPVEYRQALADVSDDVHRLQRLVVGLLELARATDGAEASAAAVAGRPVALGPLLARAVATNGPARFDAGAPPADVWVRGDPDLLLAAVGNVLHNAARYASGEPPAVRVETGGTSVRVVVADRGPGVAERDRERVFEPLTRLDGAGLAAPDGFGLGLAVARGAARATGGDLTCRARSDGGSGAEFVFDLPRAAPPADG